MSKWLLVRHAEAIWNSEGRIQGHVEVPLNEKGRAQAEALRRRLASTDIQAAYVSDLARALETAQVILHDRPVPVFPSRELREFSYGQWEGLTFKEVEKRYPHEYAQLMRGSEDVAPPSGESMKDLIKRVKGFVSSVKSSNLEGTLLIVGHGGSLRALIVCLLALPNSAFWRLYLDPASLSEVEVYPQNAVLRLLNDTSHLKEER
jgi:broad specificity phosphatase PhoE